MQHLNEQNRNLNNQIYNFDIHNLPPLDGCLFHYLARLFLIQGRR